MLEIWVDGDMIAYEALMGASTDIDWGDNIWTLHVDKNTAVYNFQSILDKASAHLEETFDRTAVSTYLCFTDSIHNFRKDIEPTYKGNRKGRRKPVGFAFLIEELRKIYNVVIRKNLEADDCIGIGMTRPNKKQYTRIIISGDKDMNTIEGWFYDYIHDELCYNSPEGAYYNFLKQTLMGDTADGYSGCPSYGKVKAEKALQEEPSWKTVVKCYEEQNLTEEDALRNARLAFILHHDNYNMVTKEITLWTPPESNGKENPSQKQN